MAARLPSIAAVAIGMLALPGGAAAAGLYAPVYGGSPETVTGFARAADGSLAPLAGSPFPLPPGAGGVIALAFTPDGGRAVVSYSFSGGMLGLSVAADGSITAPTGPTSTPSVQSVAVTPDGRFAYAPTRDFMSVPAVGLLGYSIGANGSLSPIGGSPFSSGQFGDVAITPDGRFLFAVAGNQLRHFAIADDGKLSAVGGSTLLSGPRSLGVSPDGRFLFAGFSTVADGVVAYSIGTDGNLTETGHVPSGTAVRYFASAPDGRHIYVPDTGAGKLTVAAVGAAGTLTAVGSIPLPGAESVAVSPDGRFLYYAKPGTIGVASIGADGMPTLLPPTVAWTSTQAERLLFAPSPPPTARFTAVPRAPGADVRFDAGASSGAARFDWDFGDGTTLADGGSTPTHRYAKAGVYPVRLTVLDAQGCSTGFIYTGQSTTCPGGAPATTTAGLDTLPVLSRFRVTRGARAFRYRLNERARVRIVMARKKGRRFKKVGALKARGHNGRNRTKFSARLRGRRLKPGRYRATAVATDLGHGRSKPRSVRFRIKGNRSAGMRALPARGGANRDRPSARASAGPA